MGRLQDLTRPIRIHSWRVHAWLDTTQFYVGIDREMWAGTLASSANRPGTIRFWDFRLNLRYAERSGVSWLGRVGSIDEID